jgi:hypothetical protein
MGIEYQTKNHLRGTIESRGFDRRAQKRMRKLACPDGVILLSIIMVRRDEYSLRPRHGKCSKVWNVYGSKSTMRQVP